MRTTACIVCIVSLALLFTSPSLAAEIDNSINKLTTEVAAEPESILFSFPERDSLLEIDDIRDCLRIEPDSEESFLDEYYEFENSSCSVTYDRHLGTVSYLNKDAIGVSDPGLSKKDILKYEERARSLLSTLGFPENELSSNEPKFLMKASKTSRGKFVSEKNSIVVIVDRTIGGMELRGNIAVVRYNLAGELLQVSIVWPEISNIGSDFHEPLSEEQAEKNLLSVLSYLGQDIQRDEVEYFSVLQFSGEIVNYGVIEIMHYADVKMKYGFANILPVRNDLDLVSVFLSE